MIRYLQFVQTVNTGRTMDETWHHVQQLQNRMLNQTHKLQERCHHTKRDGTVAQTDAAPYESHQISHTKSATNDETCNNRKAQTTQNVVV